MNVVLYSFSLPQMYKAIQAVAILSSHPLINLSFSSMSLFFSNCNWSCRLPVLRFDEIGKGLRFLGAVVVIVVSVAIIFRADILHLVDATALGASLDGSLAGHLKRWEMHHVSPETHDHGA